MATSSTSTAASRPGFEMSHAVVVMGVSGCGKTALASGLAGQFGCRVVDADDLHAPEAVAKMRAGQSLVDSDRFPWLDRVGAVLSTAAAQRKDILVACSALRRVYRDRLRAACPEVRFFFLDGSREVIAARMAQRRDHYMPTSLLDSQLRTLERPGADEPDVLRLDIDQPLSVMLQKACTALSTSGSAATEPPLEPRA